MPDDFKLSETKVPTNQVDYLKSANPFRNDSSGGSRGLDDIDETRGADLKKVLHARGLFSNHELRTSLYDYFHRFKRLDPYNVIKGTREYIFFTKPDLYIFEKSGVSYNIGALPQSSIAGTLNSGLASNTFFVGLINRGYGRLLSQLQYSVSTHTPFIPLLSNCKTSNADLTAITAETYETSRNYYGSKIEYRKGSEPADEGVEFNIEFEDTRWLEVYLLFRAYDEYEKMKWYGRVNPPSQSYIWAKVLHDQFGAFKFIVDEDGETILHWSQWWGVFPLNVPRDVFSEMPEDGNLKLTINFKAQFVEDMNLKSLSDFNLISNRITTPHVNSEASIYNSDLNIVNNENLAKPWIQFTRPDGHGYGKCKLKWNPVKAE